MLRDSVARGQSKFEKKVLPRRRTVNSRLNCIRVLFDKSNDDLGQEQIILKNRYLEAGLSILTAYRRYRQLKMEKTERDLIAEAARNSEIWDLDWNRNEIQPI